MNLTDISLDFTFALNNLLTFVWGSIPNYLDLMHQDQAVLTILFGLLILVNIAQAISRSKHGWSKRVYWTKQLEQISHKDQYL